MSAGVIWLLAGLALLAVEAFAPGAFMMWLGLAAAGTGAVELLTGIGFETQVVVFAVLAAVAVGVGDSDWAARLPPGQLEPDPGSMLEVTGVDGTVVVVRPKEAG